MTENDFHLDSEQIFDRAGALSRVLDDEQLLEEILDIYLQDTPGLIEALKKAVSDGNAIEAQKYAHTIKGSSANVGANRVQKRSLDAEMSARKGELDQLPSRIMKIEEQFQIFRVTVKTNDPA